MPYASVLAPRLTAQPRNAAQMLRLNPMGYMGEPERDIGGAALFLASEYSCCVTGHTLIFRWAQPHLRCAMTTEDAQRRT